MTKLGYLGPAGTFTQQAAVHLQPDAELVPLDDVETVFAAVENKSCDYGVVPLENSTEGPVNATLDALLNANEALITAMLLMPINHTLMGVPGGLVKEIYGHPQALAQCRKYFKKNYPTAELIPCASNAAAALAVSKSKEYKLAVGPLAAAKLYGLPILAEAVQDSAVNRTSFICLGRGNSSSAAYSSIVFSTGNTPGALYRMLGVFDQYNVNMVKILSRAVPSRPGQYVFFADIEGVNEQALAIIKQSAPIYRFLGSYERVVL